MPLLVTKVTKKASIANGILKYHKSIKILRFKQ